MSSTNYEKKARGTPPYVQKIRLDNDNRRIRKRPPKFCPDCKETSNCVKFLSNKVNKIEEVIDNFYKNSSDKKYTKSNQLSIFNAKFTLNNVPCELEYDLSKFTLENLQKLVNFTTQNCNNNNNNNNNDSGKNDN